MTAITPAALPDARIRFAPVRCETVAMPDTIARREAADRFGIRSPSCKTSQRADRVYYFTHQDNHAWQALHECFGFVQVAGAWIPPGGEANDAMTQRLYVRHLRLTQQ